jgi:hypothetical protein
MPLLGALMLLIQASFAYHALKTGRPYWWVFVIMAFPVLGCLIYYFVEVFPGSREARDARTAARNIARVIQPDTQLKRRVEQLEMCGSVDNKMALAEECLQWGMHEEAVRLYESCLQGAFASDGTVLYGLARAAVEGGNWRAAALALERLDTQAPHIHPMGRRLLQARMLEGRGEDDAALGAYRALLPGFVGLEARYRYGAFLARLGQHQAANEMFDEVLIRARRLANPIESEVRWASLARQAIGRP